MTVTRQQTRNASAARLRTAHQYRLLLARRVADLQTQLRAAQSPNNSNANLQQQAFTTSNQLPSYTRAGQAQPLSWNSPGGLWTAFIAKAPKLANLRVKPLRQLRTAEQRAETGLNSRYVFERHRAAVFFVAQGVAQVTRSTPVICLTRYMVRVTDSQTRKFLGNRLSAVVMKRGALDSFLKPSAPKKPKYEASLQKSTHASYPFAIPHLPEPFKEHLSFAPAEEGKPINDRLDLDLVYYQPYIPSSIAPGMYDFLRAELPFYRVQYTIKRGAISTAINTPRYTTVFGVDDTSRFSASGDVVDAKTGRKVDINKYKCTPRPIPQCLDHLRTSAS
jgi:hypothetical protein